jgi:hypothetical protein
MGPVQIGRAGLLVVASLLLTTAGAMAVEPAPGPAQTQTMAKTFATPLAAADALLTAGGQKGTAGLLEMLGPGGKEVVFSGDETMDRANRETFALAAQDKTTLYSMSPNTVFLLVGDDDWPFPIPLVKGEKGWTWDTAAGKEEILSRRIGRDELSAMSLCKTFVEAQREYALANPDTKRVGVYAQRFLSTEGKRDGLYWPAKEGEPASPMGPLVAKASQDGYTAAAGSSGPRPFYGYFFKILRSQGKNAPGGARDYVKDGKMTGGFALVAWPAQYGNSGIMTFLVNQTGIVFEKDLGPKTGDVAKATEQFNPDLTWKPSK